MNKIIIGIHGLSNKPKREVLRDYWLKPLREGLENVGYSGKIPLERGDDKHHDMAQLQRQKKIIQQL